MTPKKRYVWLNLQTGEFSCSWGEEDNKLLTEDIIKISTDAGAKLIEYTCLNDEAFEFYNKMKLK